MGYWRLAVVLCVAGWGWPVWGQTAARPGNENDPMDRPAEYGVRFTPTMARSLAGKMTEQFFVNHHQLDKSKADKVTEMIARRVMQFAHQNDTAGQDLAEFAFTELLENTRANHGRGMNEGMPKRLAQGIGSRVVPIMPSIRDLTNGVLQDVRPELSFKEQLKLTGEVAAANVALDAFEKNMQGWAKGEVDPFGNPFEDRQAELQKDQKGETRALRAARSSAEGASKSKPGTEWQTYVEEAKKYYQLDPSQAAAADSLLRDYQQRAEIAVGKLEEWRARVYRNKLFVSLSMRLPGGWQNNPMRILMDRDGEEMKEPLEALGDGLKGRIEEIPTAGQREAAEQRVRAAFVEAGLNLDEPPATAPAEEAEK